MLVRQDHVGAERLDRRGEQRRPDRSHLAARDRQPPSRVPPVRRLPEPREREDVHVVGDGEAADVERARGHQDRRFRVELDQRGCDRQIPAQMAEPHSVMGVEQVARRRLSKSSACQRSDQELHESRLELRAGGLARRRRASSGEIGAGRSPPPSSRRMPRRRPRSARASESRLLSTRAGSRYRPRARGERPRSRPVLAAAEAGDDRGAAARVRTDELPLRVRERPPTCEDARRQSSFPMSWTSAARCRSSRCRRGSPAAAAIASEYRATAVAMSARSYGRAGRAARACRSELARWAANATKRAHGPGLNPYGSGMSERGLQALNGR